MPSMMPTRPIAIAGAARALGHADVIAPPTFAIVLTLKAGHQVIMDPELGIDYSRVVHGEQRFVHTRPDSRGRPAPGDRHRRGDPGGRGQRPHHHARRCRDRRRRTRAQRPLDDRGHGGTAS